MAGTVIFLTFILLTSMLLSYTPADTFYILGVQGRYFLPLVPFVFMGLRTKHITDDGRLSGKVLWGAGFMSFLFYAFCFLKIFNAI
jgi:uncharacterized membrane protein